MQDVLFLLLTAFVGLLLSFLVVTIFNIGGTGDDSLIRDVQQLFMQSVYSLINAILIPVMGIWTLLLDLGTMAASRAKWTVALLLFVIATLMMHYYHSEILSILDAAWKCFLIPLMDNIIEPALQILRVFYGMTMPLFNMFLVIHAQVFKAWYFTLTACSHVNMFKILEEVVKVVIEGSYSMTHWFVNPDKDASDPTNNLFYNDFVIERPVNHTLTALSIGQEVLSCACKRFDPVFSILFYITREPHVTAFIDNAFQVGIRLFQMFFRILIGPEFPNVYKVTFKLERAITELGLSLDAILMNTLGNIIQFFDKDFKLERWPEEGLFTILMHLVCGAVHFAATFAINGPLHLLASFDDSVKALEPQVWNIEPAFAKVYKASHSTFVLIQWFVWIIQHMITSGSGVSNMFANPDSPLELACDWARDVEEHEYVNFAYTVGCTGFSLAQVAVNTATVVSGFTTELLLKSLFTQEQNVFRTLQRWEGPTLPRMKVYTCEDRKYATAYDYKHDIHYKHGWIWTQNRNECGCDISYGTTLDEDEIAFNPWCGQPSLNFDIFAPMDAYISHMAHGVLGPGFGDAFPFIKPIRSIDINIEEIGFEKSLTLPLLIAPVTRTTIETARLLTRILFAYGDILTGHFFNYPVNCGHGLNQIQLEARYKSHYPDDDLPDEEEKLRWRKCKDKAYSATEFRGGEYRVGDSEQRKRMQLCDSNNDKDDCMCSYMSPLNTTSACRCIARYPDMDVSMSSQEVGDLIEKRFTSGNVTLHWCNSMIYEWTFQNTAAFADALDYIVSLGPLNPNCQVTDRILGIEHKLEECSIDFDLMTRNESRSLQNPVLSDIGVPDRVEVTRAEAQRFKNKMRDCMRDRLDKDLECGAINLVLLEQGAVVAIDATVAAGGAVGDTITSGEDMGARERAANSAVAAIEAAKETDTSALEAAKKAYDKCRAELAEIAEECERLSPLNAQAFGALACHNRNALIEGGGPPGERYSSTYEIMSSPTLAFHDEFLNAKEKMNHLSDLYGQKQTGCTIVTDPLTGRKDWACDASDGILLSEVDASLDPDNAGCKIYGRNDFFCSAGLYIRNEKRLDINIARQVLNNGISLISGNYEDINLNVLPRLCDYERQKGAVAAMIVGAIPGLPKGVQIALAKFMFLGFQVAEIHQKRLALIVINILQKIVIDFASDILTTNELKTTFMRGVKEVIESYTFVVKFGLQTTGELLEVIARGAGKILFDILAIVEMLEEQLKGDLLDLVGLVVETVMQFIAILSGDSSVINDFLSNFLEIGMTINRMFYEQIFVIFATIMKMFGSIGEFFSLLVGSVCQALNMVMGVIQGTFNFIGDIVNSIPFIDGFNIKIGWKKMKCPSGLGAARSHAHFKKHFLKSDDEDILQRVADTLDWNGTSVCDHFMRLTGEYKYSELRPLEHAKWFECLEMKLFGVEMARFVGSASFPTDIMYNWKRKYMLLYELFRALAVATPHLLSFNPDWPSLRTELYDIGVDADMYLSLLRVATTQTRKAVNHLETTNMLKMVLQHIDPEFANPENPSKSARAWRVFQSTKSMYNTASSEWVKRDMTQSLWKATDATYAAKTHMQNWWNTLGTEHQQVQTQTEKVLANLKSRWRRGMAEIKKKTPQHNIPHWLGIPIKTRPMTCGQRNNPQWCTECSIVDNIIAQLLVHADGVSNYYTLYFPKMLANVTTYFGDSIESNAEFFHQRLTKLGSTASEQVVPKTSIRWTEFVANDWAFLLTNFTEFATNSSHKREWLNQVDKFLNATRKWFTYVDDSYVPFFGYSLYHMYDYLLFSSCDVENTIFMPLDEHGDYGPILEERLLAMDRALVACLIITLVIVTNTSWSVIPLVWLANTVVLGFILGFVYLYMVYDWQLSCAPLLPYTLVEDIYAWYDTRLETGCFYKILPYMALGPSEDQCRMCASPDAWQTEQLRTNEEWRALNASTWNATTGESQFTRNNLKYYNITLGAQQGYLDCAAYVHANHTEGQLTLPEIMDSFSIFWTPLFWLRWQFPEQATFLVKNGIFELNSVLGRMALAAWQEEPVDNVWIDCYHAMWLNNVLSIIVGAMAVYVISKLTLVAFETATQVFMFIWYMYMSLGYITLAVEQSVVIEEY